MITDYWLLTFYKVRVKIGKLVWSTGRVAKNSFSVNITTWFSSILILWSILDITSSNLSANFINYQPLFLEIFTNIYHRHFRPHRRNQGRCLELVNKDLSWSVKMPYYRTSFLLTFVCVNVFILCHILQIRTYINFKSHVNNFKEGHF